MRERDANTTVTNGCVQVQTRQRRSSRETAIHPAPTHPGADQTAHHPRVAGPRLSDRIEEQFEIEGLYNRALVSVRRW